MTHDSTGQAQPLAATFVQVAPAHFQKRRLRRPAGVWSLWALGVGAVISGHFSGWNLGLAVGGWGGMLIAAAIMAVMFLALSPCIAKISTALPLNGGSYAFARFALEPFWGIVSGFCEHIEFALTPAVIWCFIGADPWRNLRPIGARAGLVDRHLCRLPCAEHAGGGADFPDHAGRHADVACGLVVLRRRSPAAGRLRPLGAEHRRRWQRIARREG